MKEIILENYFFEGTEEKNDNKKLVLVIYDITDNKRRYRFVKMMEKYGLRVQKSAFEGILDNSHYMNLISLIPKHIDDTDNVRVYRLPIKGDVKAWGSGISEQEEVIII